MVHRSVAGSSPTSIVNGEPYPGAKSSHSSEATRFDLYREVIERIGKFETKPNVINILGIRGFVDGQPNDNDPNAYNDTIAVIWRDRNERKCVREYRASVDPGDYYTTHPMRTEGCAHLADGQYSYKRGKHKGRSALVQAGPVTVWRDRNRSHSYDPGEVLDTGWFGINFHDGGTGSSVGKWSAGCQVVHGGVSGAQWREFMDLVQMHRKNTIRYTLADRAEFGFERIGVQPAKPVGDSSRPVLRRGSRGVEVRGLQTKLREMGYHHGSVDGIFGRKTDASVRALQRDNNLPVDGIVGSMTWGCLSSGQKGLDLRTEITGRRRALLVAINDYGDPRNNLPSCVADANAFREMLCKKYGFGPDEIQSLTDAEATSTAVDEGVEWLCADLRPDDRVVFFYSGHGYQMEQGDSMQEVLVLRDGFYADDVLAQRTRNLPHGVFTAVLDSCFSGGMSKLVLGNADGSAEFASPKRWAVQPKTETPSEASLSAPSSYKSFGQAKGITSAGDEAEERSVTGIVLSACSENETASASSSRTRGLSAFTFCLMRALEQHGPTATPEDLNSDILDSLRELGFRQTPLVQEGPGPFALSARSFVAMQRTSEASETQASPEASESASPLRANWRRILQQLMSPDKETNMNALESALADTLAASEEDYDEYEGYYEDDDDEQDDEPSEKAIGALLSTIMAVAPSVISAFGKKNNSRSNRRSGRNGRSGRGRKKKDFAPAEALSELENIDEKSFRLGLQLATRMLRGKLRIRL